MNKIASVTVPLTYYKPNDVMMKKDVDFTVFQDGNHYRATPLITKEDRLLVSLPEELTFVYTSHCIASANDMEEESLNAIKQIILELQVMDLI